MSDQFIEERSLAVESAIYDIDMHHRDNGTGELAFQRAGAYADKALADMVINHNSPYQLTAVHERPGENKLELVFEQ